MGALAAALGTMVANLSAHKAGWDDRWEEFSNYAAGGRLLVDRLLELVDDDTDAFNAVTAAIRMPKNTRAEKYARDQAIEKANIQAASVPLETMRAAYDVFDLCEAMADLGNPASVSDAGVGALAARAAVLGAHLNVRINASSITDRAVADKLLAEADSIAKKAVEREAEILNVVNQKSYKP